VPLSREWGWTLMAPGRRLAHDARVVSYGSSRWLALLTMTRLAAAAAAVVLLTAHRVTDHDQALIAAGLAWTAISLIAFARSERLQHAPLAWFVDALAALTLVLLSEDFRSPFYVFALTTLILPATGLRFRGAMLWGAGFTLGYLAVAIRTDRLSAWTLQSTISLETVATHLLVPLVITSALGYAGELLRRLRAERERSERLAVQSERQRIAWELHDSAKQRVHAAHLVLTAMPPDLPPAAGAILDQALAELRGAGADMDTSVAELRRPLEGRAVDRMLHERARELSVGARADIDVHGELPPLSPLVANHAYRIAAEALTNAVRHGQARHIEVTMDPGPRGRGRADDNGRADGNGHGDGNGHAGPTIVVRDDGVGLPAIPRPGSHGLRSMRNRAETIGGRLQFGRGPEGRGTSVTLELPTDDQISQGATP
jgi:signal transduction histidine kinase